MRSNRVWVLAIALSVSLFMLAPAASAWELQLDGTYTWEFDMRGQMGTGGFFGPFYTDNRTAGVANLHSANAWLGAQISADQLVSGTDGSDAVMYMNTNVELRINPALRVRGTYYIGSWNIPNSSPTRNDYPNPVQGNTVASLYAAYTAPGIQRSFSPGYWNTLWLTAQLPWGTLALGKRPSIFGTGLEWNGAENRASESFSLTAAYGPLNLIIGFYPSREGNDGYYNRLFDKTNRRVYDISPTVIYRDGPLETGILMNWVRRHRNPERVIDVAGTAGVGGSGKAILDTRDRDEFYGGVYVKYNNGRFFMNSEFDWYDRLDRIRQTNLTSAYAATVTGAATRYVMNYRLMSELGVLAGPTKVSLMASWLSGPDRRRGVTDNIVQGVLADSQSNQAPGTANGRIQSATASNTGLYRPYSYLMVYAYGLGTHINLDTGNGYVEDAMTYSARADYAVAANLNVYSSFFWADRVGNGYGWGYLQPSTTGPSPGGDNGLVTGLYRGTNTTGTTTPSRIAPNIPDNNLGWEVDAGFDWKLLEGLLVNATFAYWQPGKWFNFASVDKNISNWNSPATMGAGLIDNNPLHWGIWPDRHIDAIWGTEIKVTAEF
jgi:hypothetical protein